MTAYIFGELTADGKSIVLIAESDQRMTADADAEIGQAAALLQLMTPLIKPTEPAGALTLPCSWPAVVQLSASYGQAWRPGPVLAQWIADQIEARTGQDGELTVTPPPGFTPRPYQVAAAKMIGLVGSALLFDDPGTGKTASTILGLVERAALGHPVLPVLVVCPNAVQDSWVEHFRKLAPRWRTTAWRGAPAKRRQLLGTADVYVSSYGTARRDAEDTNVRHNPLMALQARYVVADEVHKIAESGTSQSQAVRRIAKKASSFIGLSGTPIRKDTDDIWPTLYCLDEAAYSSSERWKGRYCLTVPGDYSSRVIGLDPERDPEFRLTLLGQYRRVSKADVLTELPPKVYSVRTVDIPAEHRKAYDTFEREMIAELPADEGGEGGGELAVMDTLSQISHLISLASSACDVEITTETVEDKETGEWIEKRHVHLHPRDPSWKVDELLEILVERPGQQVIAAAPSKRLIELAGRRATEKGFKVGYVVGGQSARARTAQIDAFQAGELDLICVTTQAGGVGITLTAASTVVFLQRPWSLVDALQMEDRAHRIGSERHECVEIVDIVAANTIETRIRSALKDKAGQLSDLVKDPRIVRELLGGNQVGRTTRKKAA